MTVAWVCVSEPTWETKDSLIREVTIVLFPTPSVIGLVDNSVWNEVTEVTHRHRRAVCVHLYACPSIGGNSCVLGCAQNAKD